MRERIKTIRLNAMLDTYSAGHTSSDELMAAANAKEREETDKLGRRSVANFVEISSKIPEIDRLKDSSQREDTEWHTDKWVILKQPLHGRTMFPVEIKSSDTGVDEFKKSSDFKRNQILIVINSRKGRKEADIIREFREELKRVGEKLRELDRRR